MSKNSVFLSVLIVCMIASQLLRAEEGNEPKFGCETREALVEAIEDAAAGKDKEAFLRCACWERLPEKLKVRFKATTPLFMNDTLKELKAVPSKKNPLEGTDFEFNVEYLGNLEFDYEKFGKLSVGYGKYNGRFYLATPVSKGK